MIKFDEFLIVDDPNKTKVKFNMNAGDKNKPAWEYLRDDDPEWITMNSWKTKQSNNNLNKANFLLAFAQYHPYGPNYYIFGGMYQVQIQQPEVFGQVGYKLTLLNNFIEYRKRLIIKLERPIGRDIYNKPYNSVQRDFNPEIYELAPSTKIGASLDTAMYYLNIKRCKVFLEMKPQSGKMLCLALKVFIVLLINQLVSSM